MTARVRSLCIAASIATFALGAIAPAQQPPAAKPEPPKAAPAAPIQYEPPKRGAPRGRVGGGTRGTDPRELSVAVIAPDHPGLSSKASPRLYWFLSRPIRAAFEVSVIEEGAIDAILDTAIPAPTEPGIQVVDLAAAGISLQPGKTYRWFISLVSNPHSRSSDLVAGGKVSFQPLPTDAAKRFEAMQPDRRPVEFASAGYWYDAYDELRSLRQKAPAEPKLRDMERALVAQVGLDEVARHLEQ